MAEHTIVQGDTIARLAKRLDIPSADLWDGGNKLTPATGSRLKDSSEAKNPNLLYPGDKLKLPEEAKKSDSNAPTEQKHVYEIGNEKLTIEVRLLDGDHKPHANKKVEVKIDTVATTTAGPDNKCSGTTDGDGVVKVEKVDPAARVAEFSYNGRTVELQIGFLDPPDTKSGAIARLQNLGYIKKELSDDVLILPDDDAEYVAAIKGFQAQYVFASEKDKVDGVLGDKTWQKLKEIHGC
ncbi:MAG: LysM peptidoglycan-binding domain-containing protein [Phycisphaerae bacterium]|nr:LysM peptidoglycan-binding domain-containing protein [Phycisphaerae bacterium]